MNTKKIVLLAGVALSACAGRAEPPQTESVFKSEVALADQLPPGTTLVGVAVGDNGHRYVLDKHFGLWELDEQGTPTLAFSTQNLMERYGLEAEPDFTDVASLGTDRFALTAENDGFLLDVHNGTFELYFCYFPPIEPEPEPEPQPDAGTPTPIPDPAVITPGTISQELQRQGIAVKQRTESVAYSIDSFQLFAQPQTFRLDNGEVAGSELFVFAQEGGEPILTRVLPEASFIAAGMVAIGGEYLLLGSDRRLFEITLDAGPTLVRTFDEGLTIAGMALDVDGDLVLLDGSRNRLLELERP